MKWFSGPTLNKSMHISFQTNVGDLSRSSNPRSNLITANNGYVWKACEGMKRNGVGSNFLRMPVVSYYGHHATLL